MRLRDEMADALNRGWHGCGVVTCKRCHGKADACAAVVARRLREAMEQAGLMTTRRSLRALLAELEGKDL